MSTSLKQRDYNKCRLTVGKFVWEAGKAFMAVALLAFFFYRSIWAIVPLAPVGIFFFRTECDKNKNRCKDELNHQFKECIQSVAASLKVGYAVENAFLESRSDMRLLYGENSYIYEELEIIRRGLIINLTLEELLADLAVRSGSEDILQFSQVFSIAKRNGGNLSEIIQTTVAMISQRMEAKKEIMTLLSGRQMEQNIMKLMPFGILLYIGGSYPGYFNTLYHNLQGITVMTFCLVLYLAAFVMGDRILKKIATEMG